MNNRISKSILICFVCLLILVMQTTTFADAQDYGVLVHMKNSLYTSIFVYKSDSVMSLKFGRQNTSGTQSQMDMENPRLHLAEYTEMAFSGLFYNSDPNNILVIGLGGGVIPREMRHYLPLAKIDIVEIDQEIPPIALKYFKFQPDDQMKVHISDGRMFVKKHMRLKPIPKYDYIVLDAFTSDYIPFHLMTKEFMEELQSVLADDGVIVANVFYPNQLFDAEFKTFLEVFGRCQVYCGTGNAMIVSPGPANTILTFEQVIQKAVELQNKLKLSFDIVRVAKMLVPSAMPHPQAIILTDDRAPVNQLRDKKQIR